MENNFLALANGFTCDGIFRFGKHKGKSFVEVATDLKEPDYFLWLRRNLDGKLDADLIVESVNNHEELRERVKELENLLTIWVKQYNYLRRHSISDFDDIHDQTKKSLKK